jgi:hypothetical protein
MMSYTIETRHNCTIVFGSMPIMDMVKLTQDAPEESEVDMSLQKRLGAHLVVGLPEDLKALGADPYVEERAIAIATEELGNHQVSKEAFGWLVSGERGSSSEHIFSVLLGVPLVGRGFPADPADFGRCRKLAEQVPEVAENLQKMTSASAQWQRLIGSWSSLCALMDSEIPHWREGIGSAPKTYRAIQDL